MDLNFIQLYTLVVVVFLVFAPRYRLFFPLPCRWQTKLHLSYTPFFAAIAFAASGDFMTPIGYQTNLMVYGPGGYTFKDFLRVGTIFTIIYIVVCVGFISYFCELI